MSRPRLEGNGTLERPGDHARRRRYWASQELGPRNRNKPKPSRKTHWPSRKNRRQSGRAEELENEVAATDKARTNTKMVADLEGEGRGAEAAGTPGADRAQTEKLHTRAQARLPRNRRSPKRLARSTTANSAEVGGKRALSRAESQRAGPELLKPADKPARRSRPTRSAPPTRQLERGRKLRPPWPTRSGSNWR